MPTTDGGAPYSLFQIDIIEKLSRDREWFGLCVGDFYTRVAEAWGCTIKLNQQRLEEAWDFWLDDATRTQVLGFADDEPEESESEAHELDHFKHASILAFWLRRLVPINSMETHPPPPAVISSEALALTAEQKHFFKYGNELSAILFGFEIALNYEAQAKEERYRDGSRVLTTSERRRLIREVSLPSRVVYEYPKLLKHKNFSWHALYMFYHSLFDGFEIGQ